MDFIVGVGFLTVFVVAMRLSMPRDGQVRSFLRNCEVQAYFVVALLGLLAIGVAYLFVGLRSALV